MKSNIMNHSRSTSIIMSLFQTVFVISLCHRVAYGGVIATTVSDIKQCQLHRFDKSMNSTFMQFTKEIVNQEYAVLDEFKSLHCCAKGYRSIEWFKNGKPYPWSSDVSSLILYPEAENQTIYTRLASIDDAGNYTCVLRNDTHKSEHFIELSVQGTPPISPMATYKPSNQFITLNETARLYCEAFVGRNRYRNNNIILWYQIYEDHQEHIANGKQQIVTRDDGRIVGSYLIIDQMQPQNYGQYLCRIAPDNTVHNLELSAWIFGTPIPADDNPLLSPLLLALIAAVMTVACLLAVKYILIWYTIRKKRELNHCRTLNAEEIRIRPA